jgi:hypothetical protein
MINTILFLAFIFGMLLIGGYLGWRGRNANSQLQHDDAVCREAERAAQGLYARRWLS